jgi:uncharacterized protein YcaQ
VAITLAQLRRYAVARSLFALTSLPKALERLGFVQADPIRAPARAQDLTLRHRVRGYRAGDLERAYPSLSVEEDYFVNYGFLTHDLQRLLHPRAERVRWSATHRKQAASILAYVRERGVVHPRQVDAHFDHGRVTNYWGGSSNATTHLLDGMHYRGMLRVTRREGGVRLYEAREAFAPVLDDAAAQDAAVDAIVAKYAPLPEASLRELIFFLRRGAPQWERHRKAMLERARRRLATATCADVTWLWPAGEVPSSYQVDDEVRMLAPFDPIVWDRRRFELLWGWAYRFEAYTPVKKRKLGYYALPLLWRDRVIGWANVSLVDGAPRLAQGYVTGKPPRDAAFSKALRREEARMWQFL